MITKFLKTISKELYSLIQTRAPRETQQTLTTSGTDPTTATTTTPETTMGQAPEPQTEDVAETVAMMTRQTSFNW